MLCIYVCLAADDAPHPEFPREQNVPYLLPPHNCSIAQRGISRNDRYPGLCRYSKVLRSSLARPAVKLPDPLQSLRSARRMRPIPFGTSDNDSNARSWASTPFGNEPNRKHSHLRKFFLFQSYRLHSITPAIAIACLQRFDPLVARK